MQLTADHDRIFLGFSTFPRNSLTLELFFRLKDFPDFPWPVRTLYKELILFSYYLSNFFYDMIPLGIR